MSLIDDLSKHDLLFFDTAPIIYYIEAHPQFGPLAKEAIQFVQSNNKFALTSVITLAEVLAKPFESKNIDLAEKFSQFLKFGKNFKLIEITSDISETAGKLRGDYPDLKVLDALQISAAISRNSNIFVTNDLKLKKIKEIEVLVLKDYLI